MMTKKRFAWFMIPLLVLVLAGCGSNRESNGAIATQTDLGSDPATGVAFVGTVTCIECHEGFTWSSAAVEDWLEGKHVENHTEHYGYDYLVENDCTQCHDPIGDSPEVRELKGGRDLVTMGCENCHGAGGEHYGVGPIPSAKPGPDTCGQCHDDQWATVPVSAGHLNYHPEGFGIYSDYLSSGHAESINSLVYVSGSDTDVKAPCGRCHTDEGARLYKDINTAQGLSAVLTVENASAVQCRTCHDPHKPDTLLKEATTAASAEYNTCTNCHQGDNAQPLKDTDQGYSATADLHDQIIYHADRYDHVITFNHSDDPTTTNVIEGFVVDKSSDRACRDCHNVHSADISINEQWAESGHAGHIAIVKDNADDPNNHVSTANTLAVKQAGVTQDDSEAWTHYDWDAQDRQACQRCHTATGARNYLSDPTNYNSTLNDFSHLAGWSVDATTGVVTSSGQNEMLYCWGCHSNNAGGLNNPGAVTAEYSDAAGVAVTFPDLGKSNVCVACHTGRLNGQYIKDNFASIMAGTGRKDQGVFNSHYLAAAGIIYTEIGYEFDGLDYENGYFKHDDIGTVDADGNEVVPGTGTAGPCVGCHMTDANHSLSALAADGGGNEVCSACHIDLTAEGGNDYTLYPSVIEEEEAGFENAMLALKDLLELNKGIFVNTASGYPYVFNTGVEADQTFDPVPGTAFTAWDFEQDLGAAFNLVMLEHEPGAFAHNRKYAKRLLFDSIDWVDDGALDGTIDLSDPAYAEAAAWLTHYSADPASAITRAGL